MRRSATRDADENAVLKLFSGIPVSCVVDAMLKLGLPVGAMEATVRHLAGPRIAGWARTVGRIPRPRNLPRGNIAGSFGANLYAVVDTLGRDEVLVIAAQADTSHATFGDNLALRGSMLGAAGVVTDAAIRDTIEIDALGFGAFAGGVSLLPGDDHFLNVAVDEPVICGGVFVRPGDLVLGDVDGVVVVMAADIDAVWKRAVEIWDADQAKQETLREGVSLVRAVADSHGVALAKDVLVQGELARGELVNPFNYSYPSERTYDFVCAPASYETKPVAQFWEWLQREAKSSMALLSA